MADKSVDEALQAVFEAGTVADSLIALTADIKRRLDEALVDETLSPETQAKVNAVFENVTASKDKLAAAVLANTPAAPAVP